MFNIVVWDGSSRLCLDWVCVVDVQERGGFRNDGVRGARGRMYIGVVVLEGTFLLRGGRGEGLSVVSLVAVGYGSFLESEGVGQIEKLRGFWKS